MFLPCTGVRPLDADLFCRCLEQFAKLAAAASQDAFCAPAYGGLTTLDVWTALSVLAVNSLAGHGRAGLAKKPSLVQATALSLIRD